MASAWIVEPVYVFEDGDLGMPARSPGLLPKQLSLDRFEKGFDGRIVVTVTGAAHHSVCQFRTEFTH